MAKQAAVVTGVFPDGNGDFYKETWNNATGFGTPEAAMVFRSQAHSGANPEAAASLSIGFYDGTDDMGAAFFSEDNLSITDTQRVSDPTASHLGWDNARTSKIRGKTDFQTDGIGVWNVTAGGAAPGDVYGQAVVFNNIAGVKVQEISLGTLTDGTPITVTSTGVRPDLIFMTHCAHVTNAQAANAQIGYGMIHNHSVDGVRQICVTMNSKDNESSQTIAIGYVSDTYCAYGMSVAGELKWRVYANNFTSNSFDIVPPLWSCGNSVIQVMTIELTNQDDAWVGIIDSNTADTDKEYTIDSELVPDTIIVAGTADVTSVDTLTIGGGLFVGVADATNERCLTIADEDTATTSNTESEMTDDYIVLCNNDDGTERGKANLSTLAKGKFTLTYTNGTPTPFANKWIACAIGRSGAPILANTRAQMAPILMR